MAYGPDDMHEPFKRGGAYGNDLMTMTGPIGRRRRRTGLKPGQRLADGTIYTGNILLDSLEQTKEGLQSKIDVLQRQLEEVEAQIIEAKGQQSQPEVVGQNDDIDASQAAVALANDNLIPLADVVEALGLDPDQKVTKPHVEEYLRQLDVDDNDSLQLSESGGA